MTSDGMRTAEESRQLRVARMGQDLGNVYDALWQELAALHFKWADYIALFGTKESRIALLNKAAPAFFAHIQDAVWQGTLLHLARLTDRPSTAGRENLTVLRLPDLVDEAATKERVRKCCDGAVTATEFARDWRNRRLAHTDLELSLQPEAKALEAASRRHVEAALDAVAAVLNAVAEHYLDGPTSFDASDWDAQILLQVIDDGLMAAERRRQRMEMGRIEPEDVLARDI